LKLDPADFFISYTQEDALWAAWVAWLLEANGYRTIIQQWDFTTGNFVLRMDEAHRASRRTIAILSPEYLTAAFTQPEWAARFREDPTGEKDLLVPIRIKQFDPGGLWGALLYVDLVGLSPEIAARRILDRIKGGRAMPRIAPSYPDDSLSVGSAVEPGYPTRLHAAFPMPNPEFVGRVELLHGLRGHFGRAGSLGSRPVALTGSLGQGKSQLAAQFYYANAREYDYAVWLNAENSAGLLREYTSLSSVFDIRADGLAPDLVVARVRDALEGSKRLLIVFDNAGAPETLAQYLPRLGPAHVIVTTRMLGWPSVQLVGPMPEAEAVDLILGRQPGSEESRIEASRIASVLDYLPIRLAQARDYIRETQIPLSFYLDGALGKESGVVPWAADNTKAAYESVRTLAESIYPDAGIVLDVLCHFGPEPIPRNTIGGHDDWGVLSPGFRPDLAIAALRRVSLIEADPANVTFHRLERQITQLELGGERTLTSAAIAVSILRRASDGDWQDLEWRRRMEPLVGHVEALLDNPAVNLSHPLELSFITDRAATVLQLKGLHHQALPLFRSALLLAERGAGRSSPDVAVICNDLGVLHRDMGLHKKAILYYSRAVAIRRRTPGQRSEEYAISLNNLGLSYLELEEFEKAEPLFRLAMDIDEERFGPRHRSTAIDYYNLAQALRGLERLEEAKPLYDKALRISARCYGQTHPAYARRLRGRALLYDAMGRTMAAERILRRSQRIIRSHFGEQHYEYARVLSDLVGFWTRHGRWKAAERGLSKLVRIYADTVGRRHPYFREAVKAERSLIAMLTAS
jgi:tetratricopeptide (TPR) repeat protein